jgi:hypothetical protein
MSNKLLGEFDVNHRRKDYKNHCSSSHKNVDKKISWRVKCVLIETLFSVKVAGLDLV